MVPLARRLVAVSSLLAIGLVAAACGGDGASDGGTGSEARTLVVYSGRSEEFVEPLFEVFEQETGIDVQVRYASSAEFASTLIEEGDASPADVFFSQDAGSLGAVAEAGLFRELDPEILDRVLPRFRADDGMWVGTSARGRVAIYNTDLVDESELPDSMADLIDPVWKDRIGIPPTNSSFQAHVGALILTIGEDVTRAWLEGLVANDVKSYEDNAAVTRAVASGEIELGLVNHYYKYEVEAEDGPLPIANLFFPTGDVGAFLNTAGVGILSTAAHPDEADMFVDWLTGERGQRWVAEDSWEYPVVAGLEPSVPLPPIDEFVGPEGQIDLSDVGAVMPQALALLADVGLL